MASRKAIKLLLIGLCAYSSAFNAYQVIALKSQKRIKPVAPVSPEAPVAPVKPARTPILRSAVGQAHVYYK